MDTLWYHLPDASRFVQDGSIAPLPFFDLETVTAFYPATSELMHGFGIIVMGNDVLSPAIDLGWLALALLTTWSWESRSGHNPSPCRHRCVNGDAGAGRIPARRGIRRHCRIGPLASCAGILINTHASDDRWRLPGIGVAGLAAGLTAGTQTTVPCQSLR